jgi:hypothetical protein
VSSNCVDRRPGLHHQHDLARPFQGCTKLLDAVRADDVLAGGAVAEKPVDLGNRAIEDRHTKAAALHVEHEVLAHHGKADEADICLRHGCMS